MNPLYSRAVVALAGLIELGRPLPGTGSTWWNQFGGPGAIDQADLIARANDVVAGSETFGSVPSEDSLGNIYPGNYPGNTPGGYGPANSSEATVWARVGVPIGRNTIYFSVKLSFDWRDLMSELEAALESEISDLVSNYAAFGGGAVGQAQILQTLVY